ncbi:MAG: hypothetical protein ACK5NE_06390 [Brachymonas sp.]
MSTAPSHKRHSLPCRSPAALGALVLICGAITGCTAPKLPEKTPTKEEVPFLGQQMTQEQITQWHARISGVREQLQQDLRTGKADCYQRFFVNACLRNRLQEFREKEAILRKQEIELYRQERVLTEIDKQLRLKENQQAVP